MNVTAPWPVRAESALQSRNVFFRTEKPTMRRVLALPSAKVTTLQRVIVPAESEDTTPMRRLILSTCGNSDAGSRRSGSVVRCSDFATPRTGGHTLDRS